MSDAQVIFTVLAGIAAIVVVIIIASRFHQYKVQISGLTSSVHALSRETQEQKELLSKQQTAVDFAEKWKNAPDIMEENKALLEQVDSLTYALHTDYSHDASPALGALRELGMDFPEASCYQEKEKAIDYADALIRRDVAVDVCVDGLTPPGSAALLLSAFDSIADDIIDTATAASSYIKLVQDIHLAYFVTNERGKASTHAKISKRYLDAKLDILRWSLAVYEYERAIREDERNKREEALNEARELEKLRQEEKRIRDETAMYERALQEATRQLQGALSPAERARLESRIRELEAQIAVAHDRSAELTAAQQGRRGTVYIISNIGSFGENVYKIGMTRRPEPQDRIKELNEASTPFPFEVQAFIKTDDAPALEAELHNRFADDKVNLVVRSNAREFYRLDIEAVRQYLVRYGKNVVWHNEKAQQYLDSERIRAEKANTSTLPLVDKTLNLQPSSSAYSVKTPNVTSFTFDSLDAFLHILAEKGIHYVDKRDAGGCLWIPDLPAEAKYLEAVTIRGRKLSKAAKTRTFDGKPGWFTH